MIYSVQPNGAAAITLWPRWVWVIPGVLLLFLGWRRPTLRLGFLALLAWVLYCGFYGEEARTLVRAIPWLNRMGTPTPMHVERLRVASLNCAGGDPLAAEEVRAYRPDIVLLQEVPASNVIENLAKHLYGRGAGLAYGPDTAVLARGKVSLIPVPRNVALHCALARVRLPSGEELGVASVRLTPPVARFNLWNPSCWREQRANRTVHVQEMEAIRRSLGNFPSDLPLIMGGDFNMPQGDRATRVLAPLLRDTGWDGGRGWIDTVLNEFPVLRFDQIWASRHFRTREVCAYRTHYSDHRLVVCDLANDGVEKGG